MIEQRDKFLTEAMGECWHDFECPEDVLTEKFYTGTFAHLQYCYKCKRGFSGNNDFSDWSGFGKLWEWSQKNEWWKAFSNKMYCGYYSRSPNYPDQLVYDVIKPDRFADAVYAFLKEKR